MIVEIIFVNLQRISFIGEKKIEIVCIRARNSHIYFQVCDLNQKYFEKFFLVFCESLSIVQELDKAYSTPRVES